MSRPILLPCSTLAPPYTVEASGCPAVEGETIPRRHPSARDVLLATPDTTISTVHDILRRASAKYGDAPAMGSRPLLKVHVEDRQIQNNGSSGHITKSWKFHQLGSYQWTSYRRFERQALDVGAALRKLGLAAKDRLEIFAATSAFWFTVAHGAASQSITIVTAYDTLGEQGLEHSLVQTRAKALFVDSHLLPMLRKPLEASRSIEFVVYNSQDELHQIDLSALKSALSRIKFYSFNEFLEIGRLAPTATQPPSTEDICCIMYTSGSTGTPKGVLLKHRHIIAAIAGADAIVGPHIERGDRLLAYLPLAHIIEFMFENAALYWGGILGYASPRTLTDTSVRHCKGDLREFQPTIMVGVPAIWELVKKAIESKAHESMLKRNILWWALWWKSNLLWTGLPGVGILDYTVFSKIREATGGKLRLMMNGGGAVSRNTLRFISMAIAPMIGGYGLTETCG